jgi:hypothetical protein
LPGDFGASLGLAALPAGLHSIAGQLKFVGVRNRRYDRIHGYRFDGFDRHCCLINWRRCDFKQFKLIEQFRLGQQFKRFEFWEWFIRVKRLE